mmetsp:Transcript_16286/g.33049  ORF Transcript_16286/g.33049 Transcript_16286/m.33049 type:complete len:360 (-) Transcript_16286:307-1386(-)
MSNNGVVSNDPVFSRKRYHSTKQRIYWTEEEHELFVHALKQHGRDWKKLEAAIMSKTAVQIRSHAQKYFQRIEKDPELRQRGLIPPPRPKRTNPKRTSRDGSATHTSVNEQVVLGRGSSFVDGQSERAAALLLSLNRGVDGREDQSTMVGRSSSECSSLETRKTVLDRAKDQLCGSPSSMEPTLSYVTPSSTPDFGGPVPVTYFHRSLRSSTDKECESGGNSSEDNQKPPVGIRVASTIPSMKDHPHTVGAGGCASMSPLLSAATFLTRSEGDPMNEASPQMCPCRYPHSGSPYAIMPIPFLLHPQNAAFTLVADRDDSKIGVTALQGPGYLGPNRVRELWNASFFPWGTVPPTTIHQE